MIYEGGCSGVLDRIIELGVEVAKDEHAQGDAAGQKLECFIETGVWSQVVRHPPRETL